MARNEVYDYVAGVFVSGVGDKIKSFFGGKDRSVDWGKASYLASVLGGVMRNLDEPVVYFGNSGTAYVYNGRYYEDVGSAVPFFAEVFRRALTALRVRNLYCERGAREIARMCVESVQHVSEFAYQPGRRYVVFANGVLDLRRGRLEDFSRRYVSPIVLDIDYNPRAGLLLWDAKLKEIIPNAGYRDLFQQFCGVLLLDRAEYKFEYACYLVGTGSNGKSVLADVIAGVFGNKYFSRFTPRQLFKDSDARVNMAALDGKLANIVGDLDERDISGGDFKRFVSGELFQARRNYCDPTSVLAPPLLCCTNAMPESRDDSNGNHRRQLAIYTTRHQWTEKDKDPELTAKLTTPEARQAVFNWIYAGYRRLVDNKGRIVITPEMQAAMDEIRADSNPQRRWWRDCRWRVPGQDGGGAWVSLKELYADYARYCAETGEEVRPSRDIAALLRNVDAKDRRAGGGMQFFVALMPEDDGPED